MNGMVDEQVEETKLLGVTLDCKLSWSKHIDSIVVKILFCFIYFISPTRTSSHLQLRPDQDKAKQFDTYNNTELHME